MIETCSECGKTFEGESEMRVKAQLRSHKYIHRKAGEKPAEAKEEDHLAAADITSARQRSEAETETMKEKVARLRRERKPFGMPERKWSCPENDGYHYRVFNDNWMARPGNIQRAQAAGYEFVHSEKDREKPQIVGTNDDGTAVKGYLMRIPKEIYDEDQKAKLKEVDRVDEQIRAGNFQQGAGDRRYVPTTGIKIDSDTRPPNS